MNGNIYHIFLNLSFFQSVCCITHIIVYKLQFWETFVLQKYSNKSGHLVLKS